MGSESKHATRVGFIGLGAMGLGMATNLSKKPAYSVYGYDIYPPSREKFRAVGGGIGESPRAVAESSAFLICMVANAQQADSVLFDEQAGAVKGELSLGWTKPLVLVTKTCISQYYPKTQRF